MKKFLILAVLTIIVTFKDGTVVEYDYKNVSIWTQSPMLYLYDKLDKKDRFVGSYEAIKLDLVKSYKKVEKSSG